MVDPAVHYAFDIDMTHRSGPGHLSMTAQKLSKAKKPDENSGGNHSSKKLPIPSI
jgi:hypothetical protein